MSSRIASEHPPQDLELNPAILIHSTCCEEAVEQRHLRAETIDIARACWKVSRCLIECSADSIRVFKHIEHSIY